MVHDYGEGRGKGPGGTKRRVFKTDAERKQHQLEYKKDYKKTGGLKSTPLKKTHGKFLITFD